MYSLVNKETGEVRSRVVPDVTGATLGKANAEKVNTTGSRLHTDQHAAYRSTGCQFVSHESVNHAEDGYVGDNGQTTTHLEGYFSQLQRSIDGMHHHISREQLPCYLAEFDFRYSTRKMSDAARMGVLAGRVADRRLPYKRVCH